MAISFYTLGKRCHYGLPVLLLFLCTQAYPQHGTGLRLDDSAYQRTPLKASLTRDLYILPPSYSIKPFTPVPGNQLLTSSCVTWACAYAAKTITEAQTYNRTDKQEIIRHAYSPSFLYRISNPSDKGCTQGTFLNVALENMKDVGNLPRPGIDDLCIPGVGLVQKQRAAQYRIRDFARLFNLLDQDEEKIRRVKKSITENKPVVIGMLCPPSFSNAKNVWVPIEDPVQTSTAHAVCVVGYDDRQFGGAFEILNSWGTDWGNGGFMWIRYEDFARWVQMAFVLVDIPAAGDDASGAADLSARFWLRRPKGDSISLTLESLDGNIAWYKANAPLKSGDNFSIYSSNKTPEYVYLLGTDLSFRFTVLFPYDARTSAALDYTVNTIVYPDEDHYIQLDERPGKDYLIVCCSKTGLDIPEMAKKLESLKGSSVRQRLITVFGPRLINKQRLKVHEKEVDLRGLSNDKENILICVVELTHGS